jgi:mannose-6-phosphate isomerase-like protein (cupin superfamily)
MYSGESLTTQPKETVMRLSMLSILLSVSLAGAFGTTPVVLAQEVPRSYLASPDVYKVIGENEQYRVIAATWQPGQRDNWHSHGSVVAGYNLTDCNMRVHTPDGKSEVRSSKAGEARVRPQAPSHSLENVGQVECKIILFEPK